MLEIRELHAGYDGREVLRGVSFTAQRGRITAIVGPNGCGKTTLLKSLCGILPVASGAVLLEGEKLLELPRQALARKAAYLAQNRQTPDITVERLVLHGRFPYLSYPRRYRKEDYAIAQKAMERLCILDLAQRPLSSLSGGQQQRAYIAMALAQDTPVVALDEPTTYLDISHQLQLMRQARVLAQGGRTVLMIIHDLHHAFQEADHMVLMRGGEVVAEGTPEEIYASGLIDEVFGIKLSRTATEKGWRYFCEEAGL